VAVGLSPQSCAVTVHGTRPAGAARLRRTICRLRHSSLGAPQKGKQQNHCANAFHGFLISQKDFLEQETGIQSSSDERDPSETGAGSTRSAPGKIDHFFSEYRRFVLSTPHSRILAAEGHRGRNTAERFRM
jgi:hypothetical protein